MNNLYAYCIALSGLTALTFGSNLHASPTNAVNTVPKVMPEHQTVINLNQGNANYALDIALANTSFSLEINEVSGLMVKQNERIVATIKGSFSPSGTYVMPNATHDEGTTMVQTIVFDINNQEIRTYSIKASPSSEADIRITLTSTTPVRDSEALCSYAQEDQLQFVNIDALGMLNQYIAQPARDPIGDNDALIVRHLRSLAIGPGIKSCAMAAKNNDKHSIQTLYLADEYAGVWTMPANEEAEIERRLIFSQKDIPVEGISTLNGVTAWVSPEQSGVWLHTQCNTDFFSVNPSITPEAVALYTVEEKIHIRIYDDSSGTFLVGQLPALNRCQSVNNLVTNQKRPRLHAETVKDQVNSPLKPVGVLMPVYETDIVESYGDAADDPAIWVNQRNPSKSLILGTNKKGSLNTYSLTGKLMERHQVGRVNNVGVAYNWGQYHTDIAVASNRTSNSLSVFFIDKQHGKLRFNTNIATPLTDIYGLCVFSHQDTVEVLVNSTDGRYLRYRLMQPEKVNAQVSAKLIQQFSLPSQPEGCVVDSRSHTAYLGEEGAGIWALDVLTENSSPRLVIELTAPVVGDIEGLALFDVDQERYLIASSQGNNQYAIYHSRAPYTLVGMVKITANYQAGIDGVSETDGLEASNHNMGGLFTRGLFVVQDGRNVMPSERQNFKLVSGEALEQAIRALRQ